MKKGPTKKTGQQRERRRTSREGASSRRAKARPTTAVVAESCPPIKSPAPDACHHCAKSLSAEGERALYVEEEVGRIFCSESCIAAYFTPEIERLEKEFFKRLTPTDLSNEERESLAHLRWITLQEPDEVWREKTLNGDYRYTLISEFKPGSKKIWSLCICLFLQGEPSFLYLAFSSRNPSMVNHYRRGEQVEWIRSSRGANAEGEGEGEGAEAAGAEEKTDRLADAWTEEETLLAQLCKGRSKDDIPPSEYGLYQACLEETLESPDEVWSHIGAGDEARKFYHFVRHYPDEKPGVWFVIVARETEDEEQIEIIDAFPTRDAQLVEHYRSGEQEVGSLNSTPTARVVH